MARTKHRREEAACELRQADAQISQGHTWRRQSGRSAWRSPVTIACGGSSGFEIGPGETTQESGDGVDCPAKRSLINLNANSNLLRFYHFPENKALLAFEPIGGGCDAEHAEERRRGFFAACRQGSPLFGPAPKVLDQTAIGVGSVRAGDWCATALRRGRRTRAQVPDQRAEGIGGEAMVADHPTRDIRQAVDQPRRHWQLVCLARRHGEGHRPTAALGDHASLGPVATT